MSYGVVSYCYQHIIGFVGNPLARGMQSISGPTGNNIVNVVGYKLRKAVDMA